MGTSVSIPSGAELLNDDLKSDDTVDPTKSNSNESRASSAKSNDLNSDKSQTSEYLITPHISKELGEPVVEVRDIAKQFTIKGRDEVIHALRGVTLARDSEFGPIRRGEFVMIRGPSGIKRSTKSC